MSWALKHYNDAYAINPQAKNVCLLLPGWGVGSDIFEWLLPALAQDFIVYLADAVSYSDMPSSEIAASQLQQSIQEHICATHDVKNCCVIGWSLGGNIALQLALDHPSYVNSLLLIATSPSFIWRSHWPSAMDEKTFSRFAESIKKDVGKTLKRFDRLQTQGDEQQHNLKHALQAYRDQQTTLSAEELHTGLQLLAQCDQSQQLRSITVPIQWCFGESDALVNVAIEETIAEQLPQAGIVRLAQTAHLPFLTQTDAVFEQIKQLINAVSRVKRQRQKKVAASFSKAAKSYDIAASLQQQVAKQLLNFIPKEPALTIIDAGCGTGFWSQKIAHQQHCVIGLDMAEGMLRYAANTHPDDALVFCNADLERLPFANNSIDVIFSSLAVQWCDSLSTLLNEWERVLKPGGSVCLATLGAKTLFELRTSFANVDDAEHVNQFLSVETICEQITQSPLHISQFTHEQKIMRYESMPALMRDLKNIGAQTVLNKKPTGLMGKQRFKAAATHYEQYRDASSLLPATYDVIFCQLQKSSL